MYAVFLIAGGFLHAGVGQMALQDSHNALGLNMFLTHAKEKDWKYLLSFLEEKNLTVSHYKEVKKTIVYFNNLKPWFEPATE